MFSFPKKTNRWQILCSDGYTRIKRKFYLPPRQQFTLCPRTKILTRWTYDTFYAYCRTYVLVGTGGTVTPPPQPGAAQPGSTYENMELMGGRYGDKLNRISRLNTQTGPKRALDGKGSIVMTVVNPSLPTKCKVRRRRDAKADTSSYSYLIPAHAATSLNPS